MSEDKTSSRGVLYVVCCAALSAQRIQDFVALAQAEGWNVCVIATPHATKFIDAPLLGQLTGYSVRSDYKRPEEPDVLPRADAIVVYPATVNTLNKWVLGISDTLAVGILCEYMGLHMPIVAVPYVRTDSGLDNHPAFAKSLALLREWGVHVLYEPEKYPPRNDVPWNVVLDALHEVLRKPAEET
jgi:phosphopantothenoylcysteine synthetase/decarboxylase